MSPEKDAYLCEKYPKIFANRNSDMATTAMCWGFDHNDGWFTIIDRTCNIIQSHIDWRIKQRESLIKNNPYNATIPEEIPQVVATQIKEKFGTLRFYYDGGDDYISGVVSMAEAMTGVTCEICGNPGESNSNGWITVRCEEHKDV